MNNFNYTNSAKLLFLSFLLSIGLNPTMFAQTYNQVFNLQIANGNDDGEEFPGGGVTLNSSDIEMVNDGASNQIAAFRFQLPLPTGTTINSASLQFFAEEVQLGISSLTIQIENSGNSPALVATSGNFSSRIPSNTTINWSPPPWPNIGQNGLAEQSPDLTALLNEVLAHAAWDIGNSITFIIKGTGTRTTYSYDQNPTRAASLIIDADIPLPTNPIPQVYINEVVANASSFADESGKFEDWIEIYNPNNINVDLGGLFLTDKLSSLDKWQIPSGTFVPANGYLIFFADKDELEGPLHTNFSLKAGGEAVGLAQQLASGLTIIDEITFDEMPFQASYGRVTDGANSWTHFGQVTPATSNNSAELYLAPPNISLASGSYSGIQSVSISHPDPSVSIYYTIDGSFPNTNSTPYTGGNIFVNTTQSIRTVATKNGFSNSHPTLATYMINESNNLPVVYLTTDPDNFFDDSLGIYVDGTNGVIAYCATAPVNWARDWERPTNVKMFLPDGSLAFDVNAGIKISGACSRNQAMKSLSISTRSKTYGDKNIKYPLFDERTHQDYQRIKLRNSGQDYQRLGFRDMINQSLHFGKVDLELQAGRPSIIYLNGEFWGLYNIREKYAGEYFEAIYGLNEDDLDIIKSPKLPWQDIKKGNDIAYNALFDIVQNSNFTNDPDYQYFESQVDVNELMNYWIAMTYMANYDWPANNLTIWKERAPNTKWRYGVADNDGSTNNILSPTAAPEFNTFAAINDVNNTQILNHANSTLFLRKALDRQSFRDEFIQRTCSFIELIYTQERTNAAIDEVVNLYRPNLGRHLAKWGFDNAFGGSESKWDEWINFYKIFWQDRPANMRQHLNDFYNLTGNYQLTVNYDANTNGDVFVNSNKMSIPFNFVGSYFNEIPLRVTAVAKTGFIFSHWAETGETTSEIDFIANTNSTLTPIFTLDVCDGSLEALPCNDGNDCTTNDVYDIDCNCAGTVIDSDNDGVCDADDNCPNNANTNQSDIDNDGIGDVCDPCDGNLAGTSCDDGDPNTENDIYDANCNCAGTVIGACTSTENLAFNKPATQSSVVFGATASRAVDGNNDGNFLNNSVSATDSELNPWWTVDLGAIYNIEDIEIWNRTDNRSDRLSNYYVFISDNAFTSTNINTTIADANVTNFYFPDQAASPTTLAANTTGRYIRIQLNYTEHLTIAEIKVLGCAMSNCLPAGTACDDGDPNTENDVEDGNCNCSGTEIGNGDLTLTCPANISITVPIGTSATPVSWTAPTVSTTCSTAGATISQTAGPTNGTNFPIGTTTVSYSATDNCGNNQTCSFFVTVMEENTNGCTSTSNIALTGTATQSSVVFGAVASRANDGNTNGDFLSGSVAATDFELNAWWEIDLGTIQNIETINLWNRTDNRSDRLSNYYILISDVPFSSTDLNASIAQTAVMNIQETGQASTPSAYTVGRTGRYVRVQLNYTENLTIAEVEIIGCSSITCPIAGTACDDNNPNTINDIEDGNCNCAGTPIGGGSYCEVESGFPWQEWVSNVTIGSINNNSGKSAYGDYVSLSTDLAIGSNTPLSVSTSFSFINYPVFTRVWIDFNQNKVFETNELVLSADQSNVPSGTPVDVITSMVSVPQNAALGITRMRVMLQKLNMPTACDNISLGEVEDYSINITATTAAQRAILALEANKVNRSAHLTWVTNTEFKNDHFVIERSDDKESFEKIATINSNQELSNNLRTYHFIDETPMTSDNYYRIKQVFVDGSFEYTNNKLLIFGERFKLNLYPNPAAEYTLLDLQQYTGKAVRLTIFNNLGMAIKTMKIDEANANPIHIDLSHFENGIYTVFIQTEGKRSRSKKLVVTRMY